MPTLLPWMLPGQYLHSDLAKGSIVCRGAQPLSWNSSREKEIEGIGGPPQRRDHWTYQRPSPRTEAWGQGREHLCGPLQPQEELGSGWSLRVHRKKDADKVRMRSL